MGFAAAGCRLVAAIDNDQWAVKSHAVNLFRDRPAADRARHSVPADITKVDPWQLARRLHLGPTADCVDIVVGGPPCQAFARVGRAKLREVAAHPRAFLSDPRSSLYLRFLSYVRTFKPVAVLMENVPDVLNFGGHNIAEEMCEVLKDRGYVAKYTLLNSVFYGVPQMRERMFLIAYDSSVGAEVSFPEPTHWTELPQGYSGTRQVALKTLPREDLFTRGGLGSRYVPPPRPVRSLPPAVTAEEAIGDLPEITAHLEGRLRRGARRFTEGVPYPENGSPSEYAKMMREWEGFSAGPVIRDHVIRYLPRDYAIFRQMNPGDQYPEAHKHALGLLEKALKSGGVPVRPGTAAYQGLRERIVPPYDPGKFPNKWRKMEANKPARTLMAHLGKDGYSHIHYDSSQARTISVREAARLQSFPDGFVFEGTMNPAFRQIGNAVPPLLAKCLAEHMLHAMGRR